MARPRKTTPANTDTEGAHAPVTVITGRAGLTYITEGAHAPVTPAAAIAADEQPGAGAAGEAAVAQATGLSGENAAPAAPQVIPRDAAEVIVTITGPKRGRRRAGRAFGPEPVQIAASALSEADRRALEADPSLKIDVSPVRS